MSSPVLHQITLHLARSKAFPNGSANIGYDIVAPLDEQGRLDAVGWRLLRGKCEVVRFRNGEEKRGLLLHRHGGVGGATWVIDYDAATDVDDEAGYRLGAHRLVAGEYVSITDEDDEMQTYRVIDSAPLA